MPHVVKLGTATARIVLVKKTETIAEEIRENIFEMKQRVNEKR